MKTWMLLALCALGCNSGTLPGDTAALDTALPDTAVPPGCSTNQTWNNGNRGSGLMHPGRDCIDCHSHGEGPRFAIAGTVMGQWHDVDDCYGVSGVVVHITDANGQVHDLATNTDGNFFSNANIPTPFTVQLEYQGRTRAMITPQTTGDCMSCHTQQGQNLAPGRIKAP